MRIILFFSLLLVPFIAQAGDGTSGRSLLSAKHSFLIELDFKRLQQGKLFQDLYPLVGSSPGAQQQLATLKEDLGLDIMSELHHITFALPSPDPQGSQAPLIVLRGSFNRAQVFERLKAKMPSVAMKEVAGYQIAHTESGQSQALTQIDGGLLIGDLASVSAAVSGTPGLQGPLAEMAGKISNPQDILFAGHLSPVLRQVLARKNPMLAGFSHIWGTIDGANGLEINLQATEAEGGKATAFAALANTQLAAVLQNPQARIFQGIIERIKVTAQGNSLTVQMNLGMAEIAQLKGMAMMMMMGLSQQGRGGPQAAPQGFPNLKAPVAPVRPKMGAGPAIQLKAPTVAPIAPAVPAAPPAPAAPPVKPAP